MPALQGSCVWFIGRRPDSIASGLIVKRCFGATTSCRTLLLQFRFIAGNFGVLE